MKTVFLLPFLVFSSFLSAQQGSVRIQQSYVLDTLVSYRKELDFQKKIYSQYKIQIYSGQKAEAEIILSEFKNFRPSWYTEMIFETPNYKVRVGAFFSRLEADKELIEIKKKYPNAFVYNK